MIKLTQEQEDKLTFQYIQFRTGTDNLVTIGEIRNESKWWIEQIESLEIEEKKECEHSFTLEQLNEMEDIPNCKNCKKIVGIDIQSEKYPKPPTPEPIQEKGILNGKVEIIDFQGKTGSSIFKLQKEFCNCKDTVGTIQKSKFVDDYWFCTNCNKEYDMSKVVIAPEPIEEINRSWYQLECKDCFHLPGMIPKCRNCIIFDTLAGKSNEIIQQLNSLTKLINK